MATDPARKALDLLPGLRRLLLEATLDDTALDRFVARLHGGLGCAWAGLIVHPVDGSAPVLAATLGVPEAAQQAYAGHYHRLEPWRESAERAGFGFGMPALSQDMVDIRRFQRTEFYADFWRPHSDLLHTAGNVFAIDGEHYGQIALPRSRDRGPYPAILRDLLVALTPHLAASFALRMRLQQRGLRQALAQSAFARLPEPVFLLPAPGRGVAVNAAAEAWLTARREPRLVRGRWQVGVGPASADLRRFLGMTAPAAGWGPGIARLWLDGGALRLERLPLPADPGKALLLVGDTVQRAATTAATLARRRGLTAAETAVCALLLRGLGPSAIALARGVGTETARSQVRAVYAKLAVTGQRGLLALAAGATGTPG